MKFKLIFFLFNGIILFSFLLIMFSPVLLLGAEYAEVFWAESWYLAVLFIFLLGVMNAYFLLNWKVYGFLEREDWEALQSHIGRRLFEKRRFSSQNISIFTNASLMRNDTAAIERLAAFLRDKNPRVLRSHASILGIPVMLRHDGPEIASWFREFWCENESAVGKRSSKNPWIGWDYAFGLFLSNKPDESKLVLLDVFELAKRDPVLRLLAVYLLREFSDNSRVHEIVRSFTDSLKKRYTLATWQDTVQKRQDTVQVLILSAILKEATAWVFGVAADGKEKKATDE